MSVIKNELMSCLATPMFFCFFFVFGKTSATIIINYWLKTRFYGSSLECWHLFFFGLQLCKRSPPPFRAFRSAIQQPFFEDRVECIGGALFLVIVPCLRDQVLSCICNVGSISRSVGWRDPVVGKAVRKQHCSPGRNTPAIFTHVDLLKRLYCCSINGKYLWLAPFRKRVLEHAVCFQPSRLLFSQRFLNTIHVKSSPPQFFFFLKKGCVSFSGICMQFASLSQNSKHLNETKKKKKETEMQISREGKAQGAVRLFTLACRIC